MIGASRFKLVCFDFDHTLSVGITAAQHVSNHLRCQPAVDEMEELFRIGTIDTSQFAEAMAKQFEGRAVHEITQHMQTIPLITDIFETVSWLRELGLRVVISTIGYRNLLVPLASGLGFHEVSGARLAQSNGRFTGEMDAFFSLEDKVLFAQEQAEVAKADLSRVIAIGDGLSDVPLFTAVGWSIAFNAPPEVESISNASACGSSCSALRPALERALQTT